MDASVLIDTWWNVNVGDMFKLTMVDVSFNRYMVECELPHSMPVSLPVLPVLIDTWWNVNLDISIFEEKCNTVLIDTWWNVNNLATRSSCNFERF